MCHHITAVLPGSVEVRDLKPLLKTHRQKLAPLHNPWVEEQLPDGMAYYLTTGKHCDCGTALGSLAQQDSTDPVLDTERLRRKGWSESRISRWIDEKLKAAERDDSGPEANRREAAAWSDYIQAMLSVPGLREFGLLIHWYRGGPETERVRVREVRKATPDAETLLRMQEDVLYLFREHSSCTGAGVGHCGCGRGVEA